MELVRECMRMGKGNRGFGKAGWGWVRLSEVGSISLRPVGLDEVG